MMRPRVLLLLLQLSAAAAVATPATTTGSQARPSLAGRKILQEIVPFISNGQPVPRGQKTFMASLRKSWNGRHFCAGALVAPTFVVTAAHCLDLGDREPEVHLGRRQRSESRQSNSEVEVRSVVRAISHPNWNGNVGDGFDIALLELDRRSSMDVLELPTDSVQLSDGTRLEIVGWGETESGTLADDLMQADVEVFSRERCSSSELYGPRISSSMVCAGGRGRDSCVGDSGGPLLLPGRTPVLAGITSFGKVGGCGQPGIPSVYTYINPYTAWVRGIIGSSPASPPSRPPSSPPADPPSRFPSLRPSTPVSSGSDDLWKSASDACSRQGSVWNPDGATTGCNICMTYNSAAMVSDCIQCCCAKGSSSQSWTYSGCPNIGFAEGSANLRTSNSWGSSGSTFASPGVSSRWSTPSNSQYGSSSMSRWGSYSGKKR
eukprot:jgi/Tetstr1/462838/TSEL_007788.t1